VAGFGRGRGRGYGRRYSGLGRGFGMGPRMGNPYPYCRFYPRMPRRWWAMVNNPYAARGIPAWGTYPPSLSSPYG
jgi:hypothetical protein